MSACQTATYRRVCNVVFLAGAAFGMFAARAWSNDLPDEVNINSRYTVERVEISGVSEAKLSGQLRKEIDSRVGQKFSPEAFSDLAGRIRRELRARVVAPKLLRGSSTEQVRVVLEVSGRRIDVSTSPSRFSYHAQQGWSGDLTAGIGDGYFGVLSDGDALIERFAGIKAGYAPEFLNGRIRPGFHFQSLHSQYHPRTLDAVPTTNALYHSYQTYQPDIVFMPWRGADREELTVSVGLRFQRFAIPSPRSNRDASHALVNTLRYQRVWGEQSIGESTVFGEFTLRSGMPGLGSDYRFTRGELAGGLDWRQRNRMLRMEVRGGRINGDAPLYDRFAYGNTTTLRGWSKFELAPLGASRAIASSIEYGQGVRREFFLSVFFDSGSIWNPGGEIVVRNSSGVGIRTRDGFFLYVAFPLRNGGVEPVFMTGATF